MRMHADQVDIGVDVVTGLVAAQFPRWIGLPIEAVDSHGTVNALFRVGTDVVLRFALRPSDGTRAEIEAEAEYARRIAPHLPVAVPEPIGLGEAGEGYDGPWSAWRWIEGTDAGTTAVDDWVTLADDLAHFVRALRGIDTEGRSRPGAGRGGPLAEHDVQVREWLDDARGLVDVEPIAATWARCLAAPGADTDVWIHADLMPGNLIVRDGRLAAVIDLGEGRIGDPAVDLMPAWNLMPPDARSRYRRMLDVDDATWERGRGWALMQGIGALAYYVRTNPVMSETGRRTLAAILAP